MFHGIIAITGGGTGGHLSIAKALGIACKKQGIKTLYIGGTKGQDKQWFENSDIFTHKVFLDSTPVVNQKSFKKITAIAQNIVQALKAKRIMQELETKACISVGGFCATSGGIGALFAGIPLFIHEQNALIGSLNKLLKPFCKMFFSSFEFHGATPMPYPTNNIFFEKQRLRKHLDSILFLGGSQGAKAINNFALEIAPILHEKHIRIIHQAGGLDYERVKESYQRLGFYTRSLDALTPQYSENIASQIQSKSTDFSQSITQKLQQHDACNPTTTNATESNMQPTQPNIVSNQVHAITPNCDKKITCNDTTNNPKEVFLFDFSNNLADIMNISDFCVSRAGASSLWELASNGLPTLFIPYPYAAKNHQYFNAKALSDKGYALLYLQEEIEEFCKKLQESKENPNINSHTETLPIIQPNEELTQKNILEKIFSCHLEMYSKQLMEHAKTGGAWEIIRNVMNNIRS